MERLNRDVIDTFEGSIEAEIIKDESLKAIGSCFQCGTCTGGCPSGRRTAIRTRKIIRNALLNMDEVLNDIDIWLCTTCYTCFERCPRSVPITDIIIKYQLLRINYLSSKKVLANLIVSISIFLFHPRQCWQSFQVLEFYLTDHLVYSLLFWLLHIRSLQA